jgi:hypothetical protein
MQFLFQQQGTLIIHAIVNGVSERFEVELRNTSHELPWDCKIICLNRNNFFRTPYGMTGKKYKTFALMLKNVESSIIKKIPGTKLKFYQFLLNKNRPNVDTSIFKSHSV